MRSSAKGLISAHLLLALACASSPATPAARAVAADAPRSSGVDGAEVREVQLSVDIGEDGRVKAAKVISSGGASFDAAAMEAIQQSIFTPAKGRDGAPVPCRIKYTFRFELRRD